MRTDAESKPVAMLPERLLVVGSEGRMGKMLLDRSQDSGINAVGVDQPYDADKLRRTCSDASLAIFCVPAGVLEDVLKAVVPWLPPSCIVADITSVKEAPMRQMSEIWPGSVIGTHPLFGPNYDLRGDLPVVLIRGDKASDQDAKIVAAFFEAWGCRIFESDAAAHDKAMARIQNMNFITNLAYFAALADHEELLPFLTPSFERRKKAAAKMLTEDAEMFSGLFEANGHSHEAVRQYRKMLNIAASGDIDLLCKKAGWWWEKKEK